MSYYRVQNPLTRCQLAKLKAYISENHSKFQKAQVIPALADFRVAEVIYSPNLPDDINSVIEAHIKIASIALGSGDLGYRECHLTRTPNEGYFKRHNDNGGPETNRRVLSYVLYFGFCGSGGDLLLELPDGNIKIPPCSNSIIIFPSGIYHEVLTVSCGNSFEDGRFTVNGWACNI